MASELIDNYIDRNGIKGDTDYILNSLREVYAEFQKLQAIKIDLGKASGLGQTVPLFNQAKTSADSLAVAVEKVSKQMALTNGSTKELYQNTILYNKAAKEAANASAAEAKAVKEAANAKAAEAKTIEQSIRLKEQDRKVAEQASNDYLQLSKAYNDAAIKAKVYFITLGENHPVTVQAIKDANDIGNVLKRADAAVGQFGRNVGNYKSAFDGLGFSFAQVGRELPSLAINFQTFALAISNNLPIVADELSKASKEIARLKAEGKETPSLFQRIKQAILSPNVALSAGIALFTIFSGKLFGTKDGANAAKEAIEELNKELQKQKDLVADLNDLNSSKIQLDLANLKKRGATEKELFDAEFKGKLLNRDRVAGLELEAQNTLIKKRKEYNDAILLLDDLGFKSGRKSFNRNAKEILDAAEKNYTDLRNQRLKADYELKTLEANFLTEENERAKDAAKKRAERAKENAADAKELADAELQLQFDLKELELQRVIDFNKEIADDESKGLFERLGALRRFKTASEELIILRAELESKLGKKSSLELQLIEEKKLDAILRLNRDFNKERAAIKKEDYDKQLEDEKKLQEAIEKIAEEGFKRRMEQLERFKKANSDAKQKELEEEKKLNDQKKQLQQQLISELTTLSFTFLTASIERQKNAVQEQIDLLEAQKQKDIETANQTILNAQQRADAIAVIEARANAQREQLQRRQRDLDVRKAQFDKAQSIARIVQETAKGIISAVAALQPQLIPLITAIGAAQLATVIAQPIPRYKHGKNVNDLYEGPAIVGDGGRKEAIIRENGRVEITDSKPQLTYVKSRDIVLPDANMLASLVVNGQMAIKPVNPLPNENNSIAELKPELHKILRAIEKIPQPVTVVPSVITRRIRFGDNTNEYLNKNLQG